MRTASVLTRRHLAIPATSLRHFCSCQLRVEADDSPQSVGFYARHGFVPSTEESSSEGRGFVLLAGDRDAGLSAIRAMTMVVSPAEGEGEGRGPGTVGAVVMNLMARLLHDAGDLAGAVDAYLKALEVCILCIYATT